MFLVVLMPSGLLPQALELSILTGTQTSYQCFHHLEPRSKLPLVSLLFVVPVLLSVPISYHVPCPSDAILLAFVAYGSAVTSFALMYRLSPFHPLARCPGPAMAKMSKLWAACLCATGNMHRVGPNELSIRDPSLIPLILGQGGLPKGPRPSMLIAQRNPILHTYQRRPWNRAQLVGCLDDIIQRSGAKANAVVDIHKWLKYFTFGGGFGLMKAGRDTDVTHSSLAAITSHVPYVRPFLTAIVGQKSPIVHLRTFFRERALERLWIGENRKDVFYYLVSSHAEFRLRPIPAEVAGDGESAIIAGSDTTNSVLTAVIYYLLRNPEAYERLQAEVDDAFPSGEEPLNVTKLSQMEWLNGCINEALCLQPSIPSRSQRTVGKGEGAKVLGKLIIPEETQLSLHTYSIHRDPQNFHMPEAFLPERWFSKGAPAGEHNTAAFFPFSYGPRICAGKNLALMEVRMLLCWVPRRSCSSEAPGVTRNDWDGRILDWLLVRQDPLWVSVSPRE
ncbi:high nitrogen upregulated cytochrome P450 monooxygenase 2 [Lactarius vividus]|nr:high nitrogen upregulated cytochrome P450 monooxygenase 2 [Lactarius vividus]